MEILPEVRIEGSPVVPAPVFWSPSPGAPPVADFGESNVEQFLEERRERLAELEEVRISATAIAAASPFLIVPSIPRAPPTLLDYAVEPLRREGPTRIPAGAALDEYLWGNTKREWRADQRETMQRDRVANSQKNPLKLTAKDKLTAPKVLSGNKAAIARALGALMRGAATIARVAGGPLAFAAQTLLSPGKIAGQEVENALIARGIQRTGADTPLPRPSGARTDTLGLGRNSPILEEVVITSQRGQFRPVSSFIPRTNASVLGLDDLQFFDPAPEINEGRAPAARKRAESATRTAPAAFPDLVRGLQLATTSAPRTTSRSDPLTRAQNPLAFGMNPFAFAGAGGAPGQPPKKSGTCECEKKKKKPKKPREKCYRGTYRESSKSLHKERKEEIPCQ